MYEGTKVIVYKETIPPYVDYWVIQEYPSGKLFQVYAKKKDALTAVNGFKLDLVEFRDEE